MAKKARLETDYKYIILEKYHNLLDMFLKKDSDIFSSYQKYHHKSILKEKQNYNLAFLYKMLF